jgi:putative component of membrane protein insertase Oxa1/YidC/SpoIIIJ protein YidD
MRWFAIAFIWFYRAGVRPFWRRHCLFSESCSKHVERIIREKGMRAGISSFRERLRQCRGGYKYLYCEQSDGYCLVCADGTRFQASSLSNILLGQLNGVFEVPPAQVAKKVLYL